MNARTRIIVATSGVVVLAAAVAFFVITLPAESLLGSRVKLPIFHGASTWVSLMSFSAMGLLAVAYMITRNDAVFGWESGLRWVSIPLWLINTVLGLVAALNTWDFTGSKESPLAVAMQDPRLVAQFWLLVGVGLLVLAQLLLESRLHKAIADAIFSVSLWAVLAPVLFDPAKRALHPDNPVLNSGWEMKLPFFGMVAGVLGIVLLLSWLIAGRIGPDKPAQAAA